MGSHKFLIFFGAALFLYLALSFYQSLFPSEKKLLRHMRVYLDAHQPELRVSGAPVRLGIASTWSIGLEDDEGLYFNATWHEYTRSFSDLTKYPHLKRKAMIGKSIQGKLKDLGMVIVPINSHPWADQLHLSNERVIFSFIFHVFRPKNEQAIEETKKRIREIKEDIFAQGKESHIKYIDAAIVFYDHPLTDLEKASIHKVQPSFVFGYQLMSPSEWKHKDLNVDLKYVPEWMWEQ